MAAIRQRYWVAWSRDGNVYPVKYLSGPDKGQVRTWNNRHTALSESSRSCYGIPVDVSVHIHPVQG